MGGFGIWSEDLFRRETKNRFSSHFGPPETKNQKLMRKFKLVQGWAKNGAQIKKSQNTEDLGKALKITKFRLKTREICREARTIQNFLVSPNLDS
jgi:hypothetical protein